MQHQGEDLLLQISVAVPPVLTAVHENIELPGVGVEVAVHSNGALFHQFLDHDLGLVDGRKGLLDDILVLSVEISPGQITPSVPDDDAVRIQHRDNLKDKSVPESPGRVTITWKKYLKVSQEKYILLPVRYWITPRIIQELGVSPGWTLVK